MNNIIKGTLCLLGISYLMASAFAIDENNFNNPLGTTYTLSEDMNATGADALNFGTFIVNGNNINITTSNNFANRNNGALFYVNEGSSVTILPSSGFWNESLSGEGSGTIE